MIVIDVHWSKEDVEQVLKDATQLIHHIYGGAGIPTHLRGEKLLNLAKYLEVLRDNIIELDEEQSNEVQTP